MTWLTWRDRRPGAVLLCTPLLVLALAAGVGRAWHWEAAPAAAVPADLFMQSVVTRDGELGWRQLCPAEQATVPADQLAEYASAARAADARVGMTVSVSFVGAVPQPTGGEIRRYHATARSADGHVEEKTFVVHTQAGGCVEAIE